MSATTAAHRLLLSNKDNGRGIPPAMLGSLFEMFVPGPASGGQHNNGLGVWLSVVKHLVELHGGSVRAISDGMTGSEFIVDLPLDAGRPQQTTRGCRHHVDGYRSPTSCTGLVWTHGPVQNRGGRGGDKRRRRAHAVCEGRRPYPLQTCIRPARG
ncbi:sensor histidine kinase [Paraburkholderia kirstenboschensis]|uniref:histidine kinase n=1 Tax=Paraburkholderia kirstenboschensis TaxID=1245436 RepID=A0ABZ0ESV7_9BURK|nr:sensor histidine kinase [Paraburkholderia kirstenboschensis]WOD19686.1 sensor histidine kinase [Paraburkholderia kirstenboschensis]